MKRKPHKRSSLAADPGSADRFWQETNDLLREIVVLLKKGNPHQSLQTQKEDFSDKIKFGWNPDYSLKTYYEGITRVAVFISYEQFERHFLSDEDPTEVIICLKSPKLFIETLVHLQIRGIIPPLDLTPIIINRCRNHRGEQFNQGTINTYISDSKSRIQSGFTTSLIARLTRQKLSTD